MQQLLILCIIDHNRFDSWTTWTPAQNCLTKHGSLWLDWWVFLQLHEGQDTLFACPCCPSLLKANSASPELEGEIRWLVGKKKKTQTRESELLDQVWGNSRDKTWKMQLPARLCRHFRERSTLLGFIPKIQALLRFLISCSTSLTGMTRILTLLYKLWSRQWIFFLLCLQTSWEGNTSCVYKLLNLSVPVPCAVFSHWSTSINYT